MFQELPPQLLADARRQISPIEHWAKALHFGRWRESYFLVATTVYADLSGGDSGVDIPACLVAGWWNSTDFWIEFDAKWREFLKKWKITHLHQTKDKKNPQNDWWKADHDTRIRVLDDAYAIIESSGAMSFSFLTPKDDYNAYMAEREAESLGRADCFAWNAFRFVSIVDGWCKERRLNLPEFVFESIGKDQEAELDNVMVKFGYPKPIYRDKLEEDPQRAVTALQAADFLAYEIFKGWKEGEIHGHHFRKHLDLFQQENGTKAEWGWADKAKMDMLIPNTLAARRLEEIKKESDERAKKLINGA